MRLDLEKVVVFAVGSHRLLKPATLRHSLPPSITARLAAVAFVFLGLTASAEADMSRGFNRLLDAVVRIDVREIEFTDGAKRITGGVGSGVIISNDGLVLTNAHVVSPQAVEISVTLASLERVNAKLVGWDHWTDLALLRIDLDAVKRRKLAFATADFGDSRRSVRRPDGVCRRHATRPDAHRHARHHFQQQPLLRRQPRRERLRDRRLQHLAPDRRCDQSWQQRRPARHRGRQGRRHQLARLRRRGQPGLRHPGHGGSHGCCDPGEGGRRDPQLRRHRFS
jgi:hypothetical protein